MRDKAVVVCPLLMDPAEPTACLGLTLTIWLLQTSNRIHHQYHMISVLASHWSTLLLSLRWRTKQNLDYCFLMMYCQSKGTYYVQVSSDRKSCLRCGCSKLT